MGRLKQLPNLVGGAPKRIREPDTAAPLVHRDAAPWRKLYKTQRWRKLRLNVFVRDRFTCQMCGQVQGVTSQLVCDHRRPHRGNLALFWDEQNLQTLCKSPCHDQHKQAQEQASRHHGGVWD